jgi:ubiquinone/menaquinone biosynthesis C-methylase UbiE
MTTDTYTGDLDWFRTRSLATAAAFFAPYLKPGMSLLDCGCGPGTITLGFAEALAPGIVTGIDIESEMIEQARAGAAERGLTNVRFAVADIHKLPFTDDSFDAVWAASVLQYMPEPILAVKEMVRVLKPGGLAGARDRNYEGDILGNPNPRVSRALKLSYRANRAGGFNSKFGADLRAVFVKAGLVDVISSASYESNGTPDRVRWTADRQASSLPHYVDRLGLTGSVRTHELVEAWRRWGEDPRSYYCMARCEAIGTKLHNS